MVRTVLLLTVMLLALSGCVGVEGSQAQNAYDACTPSYNSDYRHKPGSKAMVSGLSGANRTCYWAWSKASAQEALETAMASCRREKPLCFTYNINGQNSDWVQRISDSGGVDRSGGGGSSGGNDASIAFINGLAGGLSSGLGVRAGGSSSPSGSYPSASQGSTWAHPTFCIYHDVADGGLPCLCRDGVWRPFIGNNRSKGCPG